LQFKFKHISKLVKCIYPNILEAKYLPRENVIKFDYENGGAGAIGLMYCAQSGEIQITFCDTLPKDFEYKRIENNIHGGRWEYI